MKKAISLISLLLCLVMAFSLVACGSSYSSSKDDNDSKSSTTTSTGSETASTGSETPSTGNETNVFPKALTDVAAYPVNELADTLWYFAGGMVDGVEMEEDDLVAIYEAMGGNFTFYFVDGSNVVMANGEQSFNGTYTVVADKYIIDATFDGYAYYGVFTKVEDVPTLIMVNKADSEKAFYFLIVEEG